jgi:hypothetical protein
MVMLQGDPIEIDLSISGWMMGHLTLTRVLPLYRPSTALLQGAMVITSAGFMRNSCFSREILDNLSATGDKTINGFF